MTDRIDLLAERGVLSPLDLHAARTIARLGGESRTEAILAVALASARLREGDVCLDLRALTSGPLMTADGVVVEGAPLLDVEALRAAVASSPLAGDGAAPTPLVWDVEHDRVYLRRYWQHERRLAAAFLARAKAIEDDLCADTLASGLERLFGRAPYEPADEGQRLAALVALHRRLAVITGGPGTGKTFTVVKILALLVEQAERRGERLTIALLAPTGKAAARLTESIRREKQALARAGAIRPEVEAAIPDEASTIHRCLRPFAGSTTRFRHDADHPIAADVVLVDEASMVDLALMARLVDAVPPRARLVLLGDRDQLASVEAGSILGDIVRREREEGLSPKLARKLARFGVSVPVARGAGAEETGIRDSIVEPRHSRRFGASSGIGQLARAIVTGAVSAPPASAETGAPTVRSLLGSPPADVEILPLPPDGELGPALRELVVAGYGRYLRARSGEERLAAFNDFRILCAHRRGPQGVERTNRLAERALEGAGLLEPSRGVYDGRPVMVTANDYTVALFNGDIGIATEVGDVLRVVFPAPSGTRELLPSRLPPHETVFAMTIHKSQGSEFDHVAIVLPRALSPFMSRELLYTALTRAKRRVTIFGDPGVVEEAARRPVRRASGLGDLLWPASVRR